MAKYKVISPFLDLEDGKHIYHEGDDYPYDGQTPSKRRVLQLSTNGNKLGRPLIVKMQDSKKDHENEPEDVKMQEHENEHANEPEAEAAPEDESEEE